MRLISQIAKIILALFIAEYIAGNILMGGRAQYVTYALFVAFVYIFFVPWKYKFILFSLLILFPFTFPRSFPLPFKYWSEMVAPILFMLFIVEILVEKKTLLSKKALIFLMAVGIIWLWVLLSFIKNPALGATFGATSREGSGLKAYVDIFASFCGFFVAFWFFRYKEMNLDRWLLFLLVFVLIVGNLRVLGFNIPLLGSYYKGSAMEAEGYYIRIGGLRGLSMIGIPALMGFYHKRKLGFIPVFLFVNFIFFAVLGAGRGQFWGIVFALVLYIIMIKRKHILPVLVVIITVGIMYSAFFTSVSFQDSKYGRVFKTRGGLQELNVTRFYFYLYMWEIFKNEPLFGKGIGYRAISEKDEFFDMYPEARYYRLALEDGIYKGSHGAYMSILSTFGIGGLFFILVMIYGTMYHACKIVRRDSENQDEARLSIFIFMYMSVMAVHMLAGGTGIDYRQIWFFPGIIAALMTRDKTEKDKPLIIVEERRDV